MEPLQALVRGAMSYDVPDEKVDEIMGHIEREFVDLNELRVATDLEIQELLGSRYPQIEKRVAMITLSLNMIFEKEHTLNLNRLREISRARCPTISPRLAGDASVRRGVHNAVRLRRRGHSRR